MGQVKGFNDIIADYLKQRAEEDTLFAPKFANPNKSIDECCRYILGEARKRGTAVAMSDSEVFGLAVHYYDEKDIKIEKVSAGCSVSSSQKVKLTEEEKKIAREVAPDELDAELCIKDGMNYQIAEIHLGDVESSNVLCNEIARRWNEFNSRTNINSVWHDVKECPERKREYLTQCKNDRFNVISDSMDWDNFYKKAEIIRWAYIEDLIPKGGKE